MNYYQAIKKQYVDIQDSEFELRDDGNGIYLKKWTYSKAAKPNLEDLSESAIAEASMATALDNRRSRYGTIPDQLDMLYWDKVNGTDTWKELITSIKAQYPKPE